MIESTYRYQRYLHLASMETLAGKFRWGENGEAIEFSDGRTFLFTPQLAQFLEGFATQRPLPHFSYLMDCVQMLGIAHATYEGMSGPFVKRVRYAFEQAGKPLRNAGAFFASICVDVPPTRLLSGGGISLSHWLTHTSRLTDLTSDDPNILSESLPMPIAIYRGLLAERVSGSSGPALSCCVLLLSGCALAFFPDSLIPDV